MRRVSLSLSGQGQERQAFLLMDTEYLKSTVGPALAQGCAAVAAARPIDPIEYLADWLQAQVNIVQLKKDILEEEDLKDRKRYAKTLKEDEKFNRAENLASARREACSKIEEIRQDTDCIWKVIIARDDVQKEKRKEKKKRLGFQALMLPALFCDRTWCLPSASIPPLKLRMLLFWWRRAQRPTWKQSRTSAWWSLSTLRPSTLRKSSQRRQTRSKGKRSRGRATAKPQTRCLWSVCLYIYMYTYVGFVFGTSGRAYSFVCGAEQDKADAEESTEDNPEEGPPPPPPPVLTAEEIVQQKRESFEFDHYAKKTLKYVQASEKNEWVVGTKMNVYRGVSMLEIAISKSELYVSDASKYRMCVRAPKSEVSLFLLLLEEEGLCFEKKRKQESTRLLFLQDGSSEEASSLNRKIHLFENSPKMGAYFMAPIFDASGRCFLFSIPSPAPQEAAYNRATVDSTNQARSLLYWPATL